MVTPNIIQNSTAHHSVAQAILAQKMSLSMQRRNRRYVKGIVASICIFFPMVTAPSRGMILEGVDGEQMTAEWLSEALRAAPHGQQPLPSTQVVSVEVVPKSERLTWPQSIGAKVRVDLEGKSNPGFLYLKKVIGKDQPAKSTFQLRRHLNSSRAEARLYQEFAEKLRARGVPVLRAPVIQERLSCLDVTTDSGEEEDLILRQGGLVLLLECPGEGYAQTSPLTLEQATATLRILADLHAAGWEDQELLSQASDRLHSTGAYWSLQWREVEEIQKMKPFWESYLQNFESHVRDLLSQDRFQRLPERILSVAERVAAELKPMPSDEFATLIHGDPKAMNMFLPEFLPENASESSDKVLLIDFQWTGVGFGLKDVAMHLPHSVHTSHLLDGGEERLVRVYYDLLKNALKKKDATGELGKSFSFEWAWHLYRFAFVDYARIVMCKFFENASPATFESKAHKPNVGFVYRNVEASLHFVQMVDRHLEYVEQCGA